MRFADADGQISTPILPHQMLAVRRAEDDKPDLWHTFNRLQENAIRGGMSAVGRGANGRRRRSTARAVAGIDQDVKLNRGLWHLAEIIARLKGVDVSALASAAGLLSADVDATLAEYVNA